MATYEVHVTIENKQGISDPEGETILHDLVVKDGKSSVSKIRTAKMLKFTVTEKSPDAAAEHIRLLCNDLRIYNSLVSDIVVDVLDT